MERPNGGEKSAPGGATRPGSTPSAARPRVREDLPDATNSWARRTILGRARELGLPADLAKQVGSVALWYYNRIVQLHARKNTADQELPRDTNRYLVPITLSLACEYKGHPVDLERILRLSGTPTRKTVETAQTLRTRYAQWLGPARRGSSPNRASRPAGPAAPRPASRPAVRAGFEVTTPARPAAAAPARAAPARTPSSPPTRTPTIALALPASLEIVRLRGLFDRLRTATGSSRGPPRPRQQNTNAWARKRIGDVCRSLQLPDRVRRRSLEFYERIVDLHSVKGHAPPGKRLQLSPRLNWSLVYTTIYLGCRFEEYPKDLRDILGRTPHQGSLREIYGLYRFYKRELKLAIKLVDVRTFILSWLDGFELSEILQEKATAGENEWITKRAIAIANKARGESALRSSSTKLIAAGAFTTALAERNPPENRSAFYRAVANFLHMSEETIRLIVARMAAVL